MKGPAARLTGKKKENSGDDHHNNLDIGDTNLFQIDFG